MANLVPFTGLDDVTARYLPAAAKASIGRGEEIATILIHGGEVAAGFAAASFLNARLAGPGQDHVQVKNVPIDGLIGAAGIIAGCMGFFGPMSRHVAMLALGFGLPALARPLSEMGMQQRLARQELANKVAAGELPAASTPPATSTAGVQPSNVQPIHTAPSWARR
jgi:hypothetical protein